MTWAAPPGTQTVAMHSLPARSVSELRPRPGLALEPELSVLAAAKRMHAANSDCALVVSSSGQVTYFRKGRMFTLFEKSEGRAL